MNTTPSPAIEAEKMSGKLLGEHLDAILRASGSSLGSYTMHDTRLKMHDAMRAFESAVTAAKQEELDKMREALEEIALAGMGASPEMSEDGVQAWHARQAWRFIGIAARAISPSPIQGVAK